MLSKGLSFPDGIALEEGEESLLVAEGGRGQIVRIDLDFPGEVDVFASVPGVPGRPLTISRLIGQGYIYVLRDIPLWEFYCPLKILKK